MELRNVMTFLKAAQLKNFSKVADELGYVPSTVTMQIQQLETELGYLLFDRIGKRVELTYLGREFMEYANQISVLSERIKLIGIEPADIKETLRIGVLESLCADVLLPKIKRYADLFPKVSLVIITGTTGDLFTMLKQGELDLIYVLGKKIIQKDCVIVYERKENLVFAASSSHALTRKRNVHIKEILKERLLLTEKVGLYRQILEEIAFSEDLYIEPYMEINNTYSIVSLLMQNFGISFLPEYVINNGIRDGSISIIKTNINQPEFLSQVLIRKNIWISPQLKGLIALIRGDIAV